VVTVPGGHPLTWRGFPDESHLLGARIPRLISADYDGAEHQFLAHLLGGQCDAQHDVLQLIESLERYIYRTLTGSIVPLGGQRGKENGGLPGVYVDAVLEGRGLHIHTGARRGLQLILDLIGATHPCGGHPEQVSAGVAVAGIANAHFPLHFGGHPLPIVGRMGGKWRWRIWCSGRVRGRGRGQ